jgi:predicted protein tyrosine phosphatase
MADFIQASTYRKISKTKRRAADMGAKIETPWTEQDFPDVRTRDTVRNLFGNIYASSVRTVMDPAHLNRLKINCVLSLTTKEERVAFNIVQNPLVEWRTVDMDEAWTIADGGVHHIHVAMKKATDALMRWSANTQKPNKILVHCMTGICRTSAVMWAYIMRSLSLRCERAHALLNRTSNAYPVTLDYFEYLEQRLNKEVFRRRITSIQAIELCRTPYRLNIECESFSSDETSEDILSTATATGATTHVGRKRP